MTTYLLYETSTGRAVSIGTVIADPLPAGLTALDLTAAQADDLQSGAGTWDTATRTVVPTPGWVDPAIAEGNKSAIETNLASDLDAMQATLDATNASINSNPAPHIKNIARMNKRLGRVALGDYTEAD